MKTRIVSGVVAAAALVALLVLNSFFDITVLIAISLLSAIASYEMLHNTGCVKKMAPVITAMIYSALAQFSLKGILFDIKLLTLIYIFAIIAFTLSDHQNFGERQITMSLSMPIILSFALNSLETLINNADDCGLFYFILVFNFACISDIFAYFVGSAIGKHKLAPTISPKKSVEGAVGGIVGALIGTVLICLAYEAIYSIDINMLLLVVATPVLSIIGMMGDLFASVIKRNYGIKDYGNLMPGHGGVLDRLDSVLLVAPALWLLISLVPVI